MHLILSVGGLREGRYVKNSTWCSQVPRSSSLLHYEEFSLLLSLLLTLLALLVPLSQHLLSGFMVYHQFPQNAKFSVHICFCQLLLRDHIWLLDSRLTSHQPKSPCHESKTELTLIGWQGFSNWSGFPRPLSLLHGHWWPALTPTTRESSWPPFWVAQLLSSPTAYCQWQS